MQQKFKQLIYEASVTMAYYKNDNKVFMKEFQQLLCIKWKPYLLWYQDLNFCTFLPCAFNIMILKLLSVEWEERFPSAPSLIMESLFASGLPGKMVGWRPFCGKRSWYLRPQTECLQRDWLLWHSLDRERTWDCPSCFPYGCSSPGSHKTAVTRECKKQEMKEFTVIAPATKGTLLKDSYLIPSSHLENCQNRENQEKGWLPLLWGGNILSKDTTGNDKNR